MDSTPTASNFDARLAALLETVLQEGASDLHLSVAKRPTLRVTGSLSELLREAVLTPDDTK